MAFARWEVWLAYVEFEDRPGEGKDRPVLIMNDKEAYVLALKMTSHEERENDPFDYALKKCSYANLDKQTTVRVSCLYKLENAAFIHRIGKIHAVDIFSIQKLIEKWCAQNR